SHFLPGWTSADMEIYRQTCVESDRAIRKLSKDAGAAVVIGAFSTEWRAGEIPERVKRFNSVYEYPADGGPYQDRYDKIHLVLFGEFVPFRYSSLHSVYQWLNKWMPWGASGAEYSLDFGENVRRFTAPARSQGGKKYRFATPICYEDVVSDVIRDFADGSRE